MQLIKTTMMMAGALLLALNVCGQEKLPALIPRVGWILAPAL